MRVFVTDATSFVGSAVVEELLNAGHQVVGLAPSAAAARELLAVGAQVQQGTLADRDSWRRGVEAADGVVHPLAPPSWGALPDQLALGRTAINSLGAVLAGSNRPLVVTAALAALAPGKLLREVDRPLAGTGHPAGRWEAAVDEVAATGVRVAVVRLPLLVHGAGDQGVLPHLLHLARRTGLAAYAGPGTNRWAAVHRLDAARLYRLAVEQAPVGGTRWHAVAEEGVPVCVLAAHIGQYLHLPVQSTPPAATGAYFGHFAPVAALDVQATSFYTQYCLGWQPTQPGLLADLARGSYC